MRTVAIAPSTSPPMSTKLERSNIRLAVSKEGQISFPAWFPLSAIAIITIMGMGGVARFRAQPDGGARFPSKLPPLAPSPQDRGKKNVAANFPCFSLRAVADRHPLRIDVGLTDHGAT